MEVRGSEGKDAIRVDWFCHGKAKCKLGMTLAPGVKDLSSYGFRWDRDLDTDMKRLRDKHGVDYLVSLMEDSEYAQYGMDEFFESARRHDIEIVHFPIKDMNVPKTHDNERFEALILRIVELMEDGNRVVIHCRGGLGRTGLVAACVLVYLGDESHEAVESTREVRTGTIQTDDQKDYVHDYARRRK